jgi:glyoxylase-like metal-dependent hydrolase (beta-lactamase superfamily II)
MRRSLACRSGYTRTTIVLSLAATAILLGLAIRSCDYVDRDRPAGVPIVAPAEVTIGRFAVPGSGSVNTWWIRSPQGVVVIDAQRDVQSAQAAIDTIRNLNTPVEALLITHAHPDHIGGIERFKQAFPQMQVYASQSTTDAVRTDPTGWQHATRLALKERAPNTYVVPDRVLANNQRLILVGITVDVHVAGPAESESSTMFSLPDTGDLFTGDIVGNEVVHFLLEGHTGPWLQQLGWIPQHSPNIQIVRPGHGTEGPASRLISQTREQIEFFRSRTQRQLDNGEWDGRALSPAGRKDVSTAVRARYPDYPTVAPIPQLIELNADAVARELMTGRR